MEVILAEQGLRLNYVRDPSGSEAFDPCRVLEELYGAGTAHAMLPWQNGLRMAASDHLVLAKDNLSGRCLGAIAASDRATEREPFLFLDAAYMAPADGASLLLQRMLAFAMLRIAGDEAMPTVIAACVQTPGFVRALRDFGQRFSAAALFPAAADDIVIDLGMASLARRIVRVVRPGSRCEAMNGMFRATSPACTGGSRPMGETLVVVDLSATDEATILHDARRLYRARPSRAQRRGVAEGLTETRSAPTTARCDATAL